MFDQVPKDDVWNYVRSETKMPKGYYEVSARGIQFVKYVCRVEGLHSPFSLPNKRKQPQWTKIIITQLFQAWANPAKHQSTKLRPKPTIMNEVLAIIESHPKSPLFPGSGGAMVTNDIVHKWRA